MIELLLLFDTNPFEKIDQRTANEILLCHKKGFGTIKFRNKIVEDYSMHLDLFHKLCKYCFKNYERISKRVPANTGRTVGDITIYLLKTGRTI